MQKLWALALLLMTLIAPCATAAPALRDGDIIFHTSRSAQSAAIQRATHSRYSHVGLVLYRDGKPFVFEAIATVLVWKAYHDALGIELGVRQKLREFDLTDPAVKEKMRERYGTRVPLDEPVISPAAQFESQLLETVD